MQQVPPHSDRLDRIPYLCHVNEAEEHFIFNICAPLILNTTKK